MPTFVTPDARLSYVEDGRSSEFVKVSELVHGDEILGWNGEPWSFGHVHSVENGLEPAMYGEPRKYRVINMQLDDHPEVIDRPRSSIRLYDDGWRRIVRRDTPAPLHTFIEVTPCTEHPAFDADYCPGCGTERKIGG